jgi:AcrR family transcriptional regulator
VLLATGLPESRALGAVRLSLGRGTTGVDVDFAAAALVGAGGGGSLNRREAPGHPRPPARPAGRYARQGSLHMAGEGRGGSGHAAVPPRRRGRPRSSDAELAILRAAARLLVERGVRRMSMQSVAAAARVSKATIYRRWPSKDALIMELVAGAAEERAGDPPHGSGDARADLLEWVRRGLEGERTPAGAALQDLLRRAAEDPELAADLRRHELRRHRERFAAIVDRGVRAGQLRPGLDAATLVDMLSGPVLYRRLLDPGAAPPLAPAEQARVIVDVVWPGIRA